MTAHIMRQYMTKLSEITASQLDLGAVTRKLNRIFDIRSDSKRIGEEIVVINNNSVIDIYGDCHPKRLPPKIDRLPFTFGTVDGVFDCSNLGLKSLEGSPRTVKSSFTCNKNQLTSLEGGPIEVTGAYFCIQNDLQTLAGLPSKAGHFIVAWQPNLPLLRLVATPYVTSLYNGSDDITNLIRRHHDNGGGRSDIIACQKELIDAGYEGNASW